MNGADDEKLDESSRQLLDGGGASQDGDETQRSPRSLELQGARRKSRDLRRRVSKDYDALMAEAAPANAPAGSAPQVWKQGFDSAAFDEGMQQARSAAASTMQRCWRGKKSRLLMKRWRDAVAELRAAYMDERALKAGEGFLLSASLRFSSPPLISSPLLASSPPRLQAQQTARSTPTRRSRRATLCASGQRWTQR